MLASLLIGAPKLGWTLVDHSRQRVLMSEASYLMVRIGIDELQRVTVNLAPIPTIPLIIMHNNAKERQWAQQRAVPSSRYLHHSFQRKNKKNANSPVAHFCGIISPLVLFLCTNDQSRLQYTQIEKIMRSSGPIGTVNRQRERWEMIRTENCKQAPTGNRSFYAKKRQNKLSPCVARCTTHLPYDHCREDKSASAG